MSWPVSFLAVDASDEDLAKLLDGGLDMQFLATDPVLCAAFPSSPSSSITSSSLSTTDDAASDNGTESVNSCAHVSASPPPMGCAHGKEAARIASNSARLYRYYRSQGELVGLRRKVEELQAHLVRLKKEDARACDITLGRIPSPFVEDADEEIDARDNAPLKRTPPTLAEHSTCWRGAAMEEHRRLQRAQAVKRKLKRLLDHYKSSTKHYVDCLASEGAASRRKNEPTLGTPPALPLPGAETVDALMSNGVVILRELYHIACGECGVAPAIFVPMSTGGKLAYSFLLGSGIDIRRSREFAFPQGDPRSISSLWLRGVRAQGPRRNIVRTVMKTHGLEHICYERKFTWRPDALGTNVSVALDGATVMQTFETVDHAAFVWTVSFHASDSSASALPLFRASGWMVFYYSLDGSVICHSSARVHSALATSGTRSRDNDKRDSAVNAWLETLQAKQLSMWKRLLLVV